MVGFTVPVVMKATLPFVGVVALFAAAIPSRLHAQTNVPRITAAGRTNGAFSLAWTNTGSNGVTIERRTSLTSGSWAAIASNNTVGAHSDTNAPGGMAFYRLVMVAGGSPSAPMNMALIPAGGFSMGNHTNSNEGNADELPVHTVNVSAFFIDQYEVTKTLWDGVANWAATNGYDISEAGASAQGGNHPVWDVTWFEAVKWCNARSQQEALTPCYTLGGVTYKTGTSDTVVCNFSANGYRLPTEAEWEKAARGGLSGKRFPWGDTITHGEANYYSSSSFSYDVSPTSAGHPTYATGNQPWSSPVGSFAPNGYGLFDMAGNMREWCWDWYSSSYYSLSPGTNPTGPSTVRSYRVRRGGSWSFFAEGARVADRDNFDAGSSTNFLGFRCVRTSLP